MPLTYKYRQTMICDIRLVLWCPSSQFPVPSELALSSTSLAYHRLALSKGFVVVTYMLVLNIEVLRGSPLDEKKVFTWGNGSYMLTDPHSMFANLLAPEAPPFYLCVQPPETRGCVCCVPPPPLPSTNSEYCNSITMQRS